MARARGSVVAGALLAALASASLAGVAPAARAVLERADTLLDELCEHVRGRADPAWMLERLEAAPAAERAALWQALAEVADGSPALTAGQRETVRSSVLIAVRALAGSTDDSGTPAEPDAPRALVPLEVLGALGNAGDLPLASELALAAAGTTDDAELVRGFELAVEGILARDARAWEQLRSMLATLPPELLARLLAVVGRSDSPERLVTLEAFLGRDDSLDAAALSQVARACADLDSPLGAERAQRVRAFLGAGSAATREQAALVAGRLADEEATAALLRLLEDPSAGVRENARWALHRISGLEYDAGDPRWRRWHETELQWWAERAPALLRALRSDDRVELVAAVNELARRRLFRKDLVESLSPLTRSPDREIAVLACDALGALESGSAVPVLVEALARPEDGVRSSACAALTKITGKKLPPSRERWMRSLQAPGSATAR